MNRLKKVIKAVPLWSRVFLCAFPLAVLLHIVFVFSGEIAEIYCRTVGHGLRCVLAAITNIFPMSIAEACLLFLPFIFVSLVVYVIKYGGNHSFAVRVVSGLFSVVTLVYSLFVFTFAAGFYVKDIGEYIGVVRRDITLDELYEATLIVAEETNRAYGETEGRGPLSTTMGMDTDELCGIIQDGFDKLYSEYSYPLKMSGRVKPVVLSEPMTYTHISGVYTFFTGEANINVNYPDFVIPYTAAHEMSHQRGISREDEANFAAFLVCITADDPYVRYSGYLNMYEYMASALASASPEKYMEVRSGLDAGVVRELAAYSTFFNKYRESVAGKISNKVNDSYLTVMAGTDSRSYGMVVDLATVYLLEHK